MFSFLILTQEKISASVLLLCVFLHLSGCIFGENGVRYGYENHND